MHDGQFLTTRWSVVARAGGEGPQERESALANLCDAYWYPIYAFARRRGEGPEEAKDLVQSFFVRLLEGTIVERADEERGRFRSYLMACFVHFARDQGQRERAAKRGGGRKMFSLDANRAEGRFEEERSEEGDPERLFLASWARTLLEEVLLRLQREYADKGKAEMFDVLRPTLMGGEIGYRDLAQGLGTTEGAVKTAAYRLRQRFGELLRSEIAATLEDPTDEELIEEELGSLFRALER